MCCINHEIIFISILSLQIDPKMSLFYLHSWRPFHLSIDLLVLLTDCYKKLTNKYKTKNEYEK